MNRPVSASSHRTPVLAVRSVAADRVEADDVAAWLALEPRAAEPNAFLSPHFVLPATRHLTANRATIVFFIERLALGTCELVGVGVFDRTSPSLHFPLPRLIAYRSPHSYLDGLLLDRDCHGAALEALLRYIRAEMPGSHCVEFGSAWADGRLVAEARTDLSTGGFNSRCRGAIPRAIMVPSACPELLAGKALASRVRDLKRRQRGLAKSGQVEWRWHRDEGIPQASVEAFLALEHKGWKGEGGTSLRSCPSGEAFFREVVSGFASQRRALFTELCLNGVPIASCCSFISAHVCFGFKIGWDIEFRSFAPAKINELELMRHAPQAFADIEYFDSGAAPDSYINELWLTRRVLTRLAIPTRPTGALALKLSDLALRLKRFVNGAGNAGAVPAIESAFAG